MLAHFLSLHGIVAPSTGRVCFAGRRVVELGCGVGAIPGLVAARLGARQVLLTDLPDVVPQLSLNIAANGLAGVAQAAELPFGAAAATLLYEGTFEVLLAADVLSDATLHCGLAQWLERLGGPGAQAYISAPRGHGARRQFFEVALPGVGWRAQELDAAGACEAVNSGAGFRENFGVWLCWRSLDGEPCLESLGVAASPDHSRDDEGASSAASGFGGSDSDPPLAPPEEDVIGDISDASSDMPLAPPESDDDLWVAGVGGG